MTLMKLLYKLQHRKNWMLQLLIME